MGKWVEVRCNCPNRIARKQDESRPWEYTYDCGHRDGAVVQFWPGYLYEMACCLHGLFNGSPDLWRTFEVFAKLEQWPRGDEYLEISSGEAVAFQLELEELLKLNEGASVYSYEILRKWRDHWERFFDDSWHKEDAGSVSEIIDDGLRLCTAAIETRNPIEFRW